MKRFLVAGLCLTVAAGAAAADPQSEAFTYQGKLELNGQPTNGTVAMSFKLYDAAVDGQQVGATVTDGAVAVSNGAFSKQLSYPGAFTGTQLWLEIAANGQVLTPRQLIGSAPAAQFANNGARAIRFKTNAPSSQGSPQQVVLATLGGFTLLAQCSFEEFGNVRGSVYATNTESFSSFSVVNFQVNDVGTFYAGPAHATGLGPSTAEAFGISVSPPNYVRAWTSPFVIASTTQKDTVTLNLHLLIDAHPGGEGCQFDGTAVLGR